MNFAERLAALPATGHLTAIELTGPDGEAARIENIPGSQGSVRLYAYLLAKHGALHAEAAAEGLIALCRTYGGCPRPSGQAP
jgi:hypothetical protein